MLENEKALINLVPDSIDNAVKNITDKPTQNIGTTFSDIWYLVFGGISQAAEKRKLKYSYALQEFEKELQAKISKIPKEKRKEPDIQIVAKALEEAKYCIDKEELRHMFSSLISSAMNTDFSVSPVIANIVSVLSPMEAKILRYYYTHSEIDIEDLQDYLQITYDNIGLVNSLNELEHLSLIYTPSTSSFDSKFGYLNTNGVFASLGETGLTLLGLNLCMICLG